MSILENNVAGITPDNFAFTEVTPDVVLDIVYGFKNSDSVDFYGVSVNLLKKVINCIVEPLTHCLNKCMVENKFPDALKISRVVPIYKKGERDCPASYRPISITPVFSKVLESIMYRQVSTYLESFNIISNAQYGFRKGKSTIQAMDSLVKFVLQVFEAKGLAQATFCDLSRAFDCVEHSILLDKLTYYGMSITSTNMFKSFLENRKQIVCIGSERSSVINVKFGVPQGSVLGPLLFVLMINDLPSFVNSYSVLYADDTTFLTVSKDYETLKNLTENTLSQASLWFRANGFLLNESKTQQLDFSLRELPIGDRVREVKCLGIYIDSRLSWEAHINNMAARLSRVIYLIRNLKSHISDNYIRSTYFAFFQSIMSYGILLWGNSSYVHTILLLQKKVIRIICGAQRLDHCRPLFIGLRCLTVINLYIYNVLLYVKGNISNLALRESIHSHETRNRKCIDIPFQRLTKTQKNYETLGLKMYNKLNQQLQELPVNIFKAKLYEFLVNNPFYSITEFFEGESIAM